MAKKSGVTPSEIIKRLAKIKNAEKIRKEADDKYGYSRAIKEYAGDFVSSMPSWLQGIDLIPINEVYAFAKTFVPSIYSRDPYIAVNPKGSKFIIGAKMLEMGVNAYWRALDLKHQIKRCLFDAMFAEGILKLGYSASLGDSSKQEGEMSLDPSCYVKEKEIFAKRISWKNIIRDPNSTDGFHDCRFIAHELILPIEAVRNSNLYENTENLQPNYTVEISGPSEGRRAPQYRTEEQFVVLYEEWNQDEEKVYTYAEGCSDYLMNKKWPYRFDGYPFELIRFNAPTDEPYAPNLIAPWEPQLWEKMKIRAMELDHLKRFGRQYISEKGSFSRIEKDKLMKGISGAVIEKEQGKPDPSILQYPAIQTDMYAVENRIDMDKDNISGQPNAVRSAPQKTQSRTLGEVDRLISSFQSRQSDPQAEVEYFSEEISKKLIGLMQQYFDKAKYIRAAPVDKRWLERQMKDNPDSDKFEAGGFMLNRDDIKNIEFEVEVRAGSTLPMNRENRMKSMISIIELGQRIGIMEGDKLSRVIGKNLVAEFDMPEVDNAYEEVLRKIEAGEQVNKVRADAENMMSQNKIRQMKAQMAGGGNGAGPMIPPGLV